MGTVPITDNERPKCKLSPIGQLKCTLSGPKGLSCKLGSTRQLKCILSGSKGLNCTLSFAQSVEQPSYPGPYNARPSSSEQIFATKSKSMKQDFAVNPIPYFEVSNEYGTTVNIGG